MKARHMKQRKICFYALMAVMVCGIINGQQKKQLLPLPKYLKDFQNELIESEIGIVLPPKKPEVKDQQKKELQINNKYKKFLALHDETEKLFIERQKYLAVEDPKEKRHYKPKIEALEKQIPQKRKKFYQEARHIRQSLEKDYMKVKEQYDALIVKSLKAKKAGNNAYAEKCSEDAEKLTEKLALLEEPINVLNSFLFFNEYYSIENDKDMQKAYEIAGYDRNELERRYKQDQRKIRTTKTKQKSEKKD